MKTHALHASLAGHNPWAALEGGTQAGITLCRACGFFWRIKFLPFAGMAGHDPWAALGGRGAMSPAVSAAAASQPQTWGEFDGAAATAMATEVPEAAHATPTPEIEGMMHTVNWLGAGGPSCQRGPAVPEGLQRPPCREAQKCKIELAQSYDRDCIDVDCRDRLSVWRSVKPGGQGI